MNLNPPLLAMRELYAPARRIKTLPFPLPSAHVLSLLEHPVPLAE
jgi:hypothetical protein